MTTHFRIEDEDGDVCFVGPSRGFPSLTEATLFLILTPGVPVSWRPVPYDPDALPLPDSPRLIQ